MITAFLLRAVIVGGLIGLAAALAEYVLTSLGRSTRFVWIAALMLGTTLPFAGLLGERAAGMADVTYTPVSAGSRGAPSAMGAPVGGSAGSDATPQSGSGGARARTAGDSQDAATLVAGAATWAGAPFRAAVRFTVPAWMAAFDSTVTLLWAATSLLWGAILITSAVRIHRGRNHWRASMLDGMPVYMSHDVGPALFGLTRFGIVVPAWVAELQLEQRRLIVAHEREHARAGDPVTLLVGALLVLVQPLNPAMWAMFRRLRLAIEIDCDARVLAGTADVKVYGALLLDVGERTLTGAAPVAALSEGGAQLERRIVAMSRRQQRRGGMRTLAAAAASITLVAGVWKLPLPAVASAQELHGAHAAFGAPEGAGGVAEGMPADSIAARRARRTASVPGAAPAPSADTIGEPARRAIVRVNRLGLNNAPGTPEILVWAVGGPVWVAVAGGPMRPLLDTLRLDRLPALRFDVTEGHAFMRLASGGTMSLSADAEGGGAQRFTVQAAQVAFLRGGHGVAQGDDLPERLDAITDPRIETLSDAVLRRILEERYPGLLDAAGPAEYVWLLVDGQDRVLQSNRGLGDLPRRSDGQLGFMDARVTRTMLPAMAPAFKPGEGYGWKRLRANNDRTINVMWVRQLSRGTTTGSGGRGGSRP